MKAFLAAVVVSIIVATGAAYVLDNQFQTTSTTAFTTSGARVDDSSNSRVGF